MESKIDKNIIGWVVKNRPKNKEEISQYFLDEKSLFKTLKYLEPWVRNRKILFLGDGDHISLLMAYFFNVNASIYDIDSDITSNLKKLAIKLDIPNKIKVFPYDAREEWNENEKFDVFHINPPFAKNNKSKGAILWLQRCLQKTNFNGLGICNIPTTRQREWSSDNWFEVQKFLSINNCIIDSISKPFQSYENVNPRRKIHSSIVLLHKIGELQSEIIVPNELYY